jgi:phosphoenolpyruvate synthase/pyruvate phosphate dikinase
MNIAEGILTARGGVTSHAAVVEWEMLFQVGSININYKTRIMTIGGKSIQKENGFL